MTDSQFTSCRPYLIRAFYEWLIDNHLTPHLVINIHVPNVLVPVENSWNGQIILNISPNAVNNLELRNDKILFTTCFSGILKEISIPPISVIAIYARENGEGMIFEQGIEDTIDRSPALDNYTTPIKNSTMLSIIKNDDKNQYNTLNKIPDQDNKKKSTEDKNYLGLHLVQ
ncbi:ClpXP protease specificity-enhancing factor [Candidatus Erwinia haradaeae]|uniref:Stringent starvation protein B n=1 Tax=Candidatus Erwinia haradaeae TaxID=1922217 RepID=A0A451DGM3_9GAMM|nr:ClpXP protease specificity-enhancing factor [Candidatus Erwinia haradaeae]VFP85789.1 Stringent starvation protein B [Candidatus Erwinia haradaeae]